MADDLDFDALFPGDPATPPAPAAPEAAPAAPAFSAEDVAALRQQQVVQEQKLKDLGRVLSGEGTGTAPQQMEITDPIAYAEWVRSQARSEAAQAAAQQYEIAHTVNELKAANPHLVQFEGEIRVLADQLYAKAVQSGQPVNNKAILTQAVEIWNEKLKSYSTASQQQRTQEQVKQNALPFSDTSSSAAPSSLTSLADAVAWAKDASGNPIPERWQAVRKAQQQGRLK